MQDKKRIFQAMSRFLTWFLLACTSVTTTWAQKIPFENFTIKNGLPQSTVNDIDQDHQGYIWIATQVGAARYDGYDFKYLTTDDGLPDDFINCLLVDSRDRLWFGTQGGIGVYDGHAFITYKKEQGLVDNRVDDLLEDRNGNIWVTTAYGLSVITGDTVLTYTFADALTDNNVSDIMMDSGGRIQVATYPVSGLTIFTDPYHYEKLPQPEIIREIIEVSPGEIWYATQGKGIFVSGNNEFRKLGKEEGLTDEIVLSIHQMRNGEVWCGTYVDGLFVYREGRFHPLENNQAHDLLAAGFLEDQHGRIWIKSFDEGVWMYDAGDLRHFTVQNNLVHNVIQDIFEDKFGTIWIATLKGISKYGKGIFEIYDKDYVPELPDNVQSVFVDSRGWVWFGSTGRVFIKQAEKTLIADEELGFRRGDALPLSYAEDRFHNIYIGTDIQLLYYNGNSIVPVYLDKDKDKNISINSLLYTGREQLWCATDSGIYLYGNRGVAILGEREGLPDPQVDDLARFDQMIYCATEGGVAVFDQDGKHLRDYTVADGLESNLCIDLTTDNDGNIWVATRSNGISKIPAQRNMPVTNYTTREGLISNSTYFVEFADSVSLWIGTNRGINVLHTETGEITLYGYEEGFYPVETHARAVSRGRDGSLWIGTVEGLVHYNPRYDTKSDLPPDLVFYPPLVDGRVFSESDKRKKRLKESRTGNPVFPYGKNSLEFHFTAIHTTNPLLNRTSYFLEGFDKDWSPPGTAQSVPYMRLPNGDYVFRVKAFNPDGVETEHEASFAFTIKPPFWKTFWFILFEIIAVLTLILAVIKFRERQLIREKKVLETKVRERTREIEAQKLEIEMQRDQIAEQKGYVEEQRDRIAEQKQEITDSIQYARRIQQAVLPGKQMLEQTLPDHFIFFKPRDIVSGDFYWVDRKDDQIIVCAADCTGHGVPGAFMSLLGLTFLNEIVNKDGILKASEILNRLRVSIMKSMSHRGGTDQAWDGMDLSLVIINRKLNMLEFAGAYNPLILSRNSEIIEYKGDKMPVGKHVGEEKPFTNHRVPLLAGDMLYLFSDGFPDQFGGEKGSKYKARAFKRFLSGISEEPVDKQSELLEQELHRWMGNTPQVDDILVMGIRYV